MFWMSERKETQLIEFDAPPVIETVLSIQFAALPGFTAAHGGCFWQSSLAAEWPNAKLAEAPRIEDEFEVFGTKPNFRSLGLEFRPIDTSRTQITNGDEDRMIQVQDSRFIYNWRKRGGSYPRYSAIKPELNRLYARFVDYLQCVTSPKFPTPKPNQWEITYINHIPKNGIWNKALDWPEILPGLYIPTAEPHGAAELESLAGMWRYRLSDNRGRLHISLQHGQTAEKVEVMVLQLTARGPVDLDRDLSVDNGFDLGHDAIVGTFRGITSAAAHAEWKGSH